MVIKKKRTVKGRPRRGGAYGTIIGQSSVPTGGGALNLASIARAGKRAYDWARKVKPVGTIDGLLEKAGVRDVVRGVLNAHPVGRALVMGADVAKSQGFGAKKRRGRPRKLEVVLAVPKSKTIRTKPSAMPAKRRGRPRKMVM